jgi:hypothetical protein
MSRTSGLPDSEAGLLTRIIYWLTKGRRGRLHLADRVRAFDPTLLKITFWMDRYTAAHGIVPSILKELAIIKVATIVGCPL